MDRERNILTPLGTFVLAAAVISFAFGWLLGWIELIVLATACMLALALALPFVLGRLYVDITRHLPRERILVGEREAVNFTFTNRRPAPIRSRQLRDLMRSTSNSWQGERDLDVPPLGPHATAHTSYQLPALARGRYEIGPAVISRSDPLQLMRRDIKHSGVDRLWVHPRYVAIAALPVGFAKDIEGPTSDTSPVGDVAFHSLREYVEGDDFRHIHWMSSARTGRTMVRHYVDNRRPHLAVLLDTSAGQYNDEQFETAVEVTASLAVSAVLHHEPVTVWAGRSIIVSGRQPATRDTILDQLSVVSTSGSDPLAAVAGELVRSERGISAVAIVTAGCPSVELLPTVEQIRGRARPIVIRVWPRSQLRNESLPRAQSFDVDSSATFAAMWQGTMR